MTMTIIIAIAVISVSAVTILMASIPPPRRVDGSDELATNLRLRYRHWTIAVYAIVIIIAVAALVVATQLLPHHAGDPAGSPGMTKMSAHDVRDRIMHAADRQIATSSIARAIEAAGLGPQLRALVEQIAANAANPIACDVEDVVAEAVAAAEAKK